MARKSVTLEGTDEIDERDHLVKMFEESLGPYWCPRGLMALPPDELERVRSLTASHAQEAVVGIEELARVISRSGSGSWEPDTRRIGNIIETLAGFAGLLTLMGEYAQSLKDPAYRAIVESTAQSGS